ncbi:MAG: ABC transporter ATP-binding protein [Spirochaetaceae bacterium]|jgi:oligopeptide transport system ATP-binding protein|nr:ABC transporter ATP-binding protein [Spirochaetaceae bacterium]
MPVLEVRDLKTSFFTQDGEIRAVRGISFSLEKGETLGIVGESGSGKSVTALSILRLLEERAKTRGQVLFHDQDMVKLLKPALRNIRGKGISMIFQDPMSSLNPLLPVGRQIGEMISTHRRLRRGELYREVLDLLAEVKIPEPEKRYSAYPHEFSGGMRQRVMIAMALACKPEIMIADEPTTALDVTIQNQILNLLKNIQAEMGMSIIFITHDLGVVAELCSRIIVMYGGMILEEAAAEDLFSRPAHPYTLGLLNSMPHLEMDKSQKLKPIPGSPPDMSHVPSGCPFSPRCAYVRRICLKKVPGFYTVGNKHRSLCWLHDPEAPKSPEDNPFVPAVPPSP